MALPEYGLPALGRDVVPDHVVMFSGGAASYLAAKRVLTRESRASVTLLFCDTKQEDADLYRFLDDCERRLNHPVTRIADGRSVWQVFHDEGMIGNTRADLCSRILKRDLADAWVKANCADPVLYFGFDFTEPNRLDGVRRAKPWARCEAPLADEMMWKHQILAEVEADGLRLSRAYSQGYTHDNCGGGCIKMGQAGWARTLRVRPEVFGMWEAEEQAFRTRTGKDVAILRDRRGGETKPLTLWDFRRRLECGGLFDQDDEGGCNCFAPPVFETIAAE